MEITGRKCRLFLRNLRLSGPCAAVLCLTLLLMLLLLHLMGRDSLDVSARIAQQLRTDQGDLASIGQHIFNAYFDTRATLGGSKFVRAISVLDTKAYSGREFICQFMHRSGALSFSTVARRSKIGMGMSHGGSHYYQEFLLSCPVGDDLQAAAFMFVQTDDASLRSQVIRVRHNPLSLGEQPAYPQLVINCVSVTFGRPNEHRLIEWLEAQRLLKMDRVQLHYHHLRSKDFEAVAQAYSAEGFVDVRHIGCPFCEAGHEERLGLLLMSPAINQCFYENLGRYKFTAVFDLDELILPQQQPDYPSLLTALDSQENATTLAFRNWYHFVELGEDARVADKRLYMLRHPYRTKQPSEVGYSTKSIHRSSCVVALHNHFSWEDAPKPDTKTRLHYVPVSVGVMEHYKKCHFDQKKCSEMTKVQDRQDGSRLNKLMGAELSGAFQQKAKQLLPGS